MKVNNIISWFIIICLSLSYFIYSSLITINYYFAIGIGVILIAIWLLLKKKVQNTYSNTDKFKKSFYLLLIPEVLIVLYSIFLILPVGNDELTKKYISRACLFIVTALEGIAIVGLYKDKAIDIIFKSALLNYIIYIICFIQVNGIVSLFITTYQTIFEDVAIKSILEAHEVTFVFGLLFLYYLFTGYKENKSKVIICFIMSLLGFKRIMVVAVLLAILIKFILDFIDKNINIKNISNKITFGVTIAILLVSFLWLYIISDEEINQISEETNINFMGRLQIYELIRDEYSLNISFLGRGLGFISYWGEINADYTNGVALHSGIIQMYVENGFIVFTLYLLNKLYFNYKRIKNVNKKNANIYFCIMVYIIICWFTDNVATYFNFLVASNVIIMSLYNNFLLKRGEKSIDNYKKAIK